MHEDLSRIDMEEALELPEEDWLRWLHEEDVVAGEADPEEEEEDGEDLFEFYDEDFS